MNSNKTTSNNNGLQPPTTIQFPHNQQPRPVAVGTTNPQGKRSRSYETSEEKNPIKNRRIEQTTTITSDNTVSLKDYLNLIKTSLALCQFRTVEETAEEGLKLNLQDTPQYFDLYYYLCLASYHNNNNRLATETALLGLQQMSIYLELFQKNDNYVITANEIKLKLHSCLCTIYTRNGMFGVANFHGDEGLNVISRTPGVNDNIKTKLIVNLSNLYIEQQKYVQARNIIKERESELKNIGNTEKIALACNLSIALINLEEYEEVISITSKALEISGIGKPEKRILLGNLARASTILFERLSGGDQDDIFRNREV